ncbi:MAG TPA: hypothetical protein VJL29_09475, partial [Thermoguttaceae bacterium]|nr:hypothetical protein [Thermoguttaceae bacterium]
STPVGLPGMPWRDDRVLGAAQIAAVFGEGWSELGLHRIVPTGQATLGPRTEYVYDLYTRQGTRILWGLSPRTKTAGEPLAKEKIARLRQYAATCGSLDAAGTATPLDVQHPDAPHALDPVAARQDVP